MEWTTGRVRLHVLAGAGALAVLAALVLGVPRAGVAVPAGDEVFYVSDAADPWKNWDIWKLERSTLTKTRLTTHAAIDNHPEVSEARGWLVWSSNRDASGEFDLYLADLADVEGTAKRLTDDSHGNGFPGAYPDRHPHFSPDGLTIVFNAKNRPLDVAITVASECCVPKVIVPPRWFEGIEMIQLDLTGAVVSYKSLDVRDAWDKVASPGIWVDNTGTYTGHPSFSHDGTKLVFTASIDGDGKVWEVYTAGWDPLAASLVPNSLRRITHGPDNLSPNPIKMSGGAHFSEDDSEILFTSTRTPEGNSLLFSTPATSSDVRVDRTTQLTDHDGNDYVPDPMPDGSIVVTSDLGPAGLCDPAAEGATLDLDIVELAADGTRTNLTDDDTSDQMQLIGDEVSWFCGLKPNLTECTRIPRIFPLEGLWLEWTADQFARGFRTSTPIPANLLQRFGYPSQAPQIYSTAWTNTDAFMKMHAQQEWQQVTFEIMSLDVLGPIGTNGFPGLADEAMLRQWDTLSRELRSRKYVVASIMDHGEGIGVPVKRMPDLRVAWRSVVSTWSGRARARQCTVRGTMRVSNAGNARAGSSTVAAWLERAESKADVGRAGPWVTRIFRASAGALRPGQARVKRFTKRFRASQRPAGFFLVAFADDGRRVAESREGNNTAVGGPIRGDDK